MDKLNPSLTQFKVLDEIYTVPEVSIKVVDESFASFTIAVFLLDDSANFIKFDDNIRFI